LGNDLKGSRGSFGEIVIGLVTLVHAADFAWQAR
jgi:hypothetical protein